MASATWPPGPKGRWLRGSLPEFRRDILGFFTRCAREYGDYVAYRLGPRHLLQINDPAGIEDVLVTQARNFIKHFALRMNTLLLGRGLLTSDGGLWLRQRRLIQPAFQRGRVTAYGDIMTAFTDRLVRDWQPGSVRDLHADMMQLTLEIVAKTLFGADIREEAQDVGTALETALDSFLGRLRRLWPLPRWLPTPGNLRVKRAARRLDEVVFGMIRQHRQNGQTSGDLLSMLLEAQDPEDDGHMTDQQVRDEALTLLLAGHETTALALTWTWYLLAQHPQVEAQLLAELQTVLKGRLPTVADLPRLRYTEQVISEGMRIYPPVYVIGREALRDCVVGGYRCPAGWTVMMPQWVLHRDPRFFPEPEVFRPERWTEAMTRQLPKCAYFPFGGGPRLCIGNFFAMQEAVLILATMAQKVHCSLVPGQTIEPWPSMTLRPRYGLRMQIDFR